MIKIKEDWEFNVLGIYNYLKPGRFDALFTYIKENHDKIPGDIVEAGVFRGSSLIAIAMYLKEIGSDKKVYGFDSFYGFPPVYHSKDEISEYLKYLNHSVSQITNLYQKEIDDYEQFLIEEQNDFNRFNKTGRKLNFLN